MKNSFKSAMTLGQCFLKLLKFLVGAVQPCGQRQIEVQGEDLHEALAVYLMAGISQQNGIGLSGCQLCKVLNLLDRVEFNGKFFNNPP